VTGSTTTAAGSTKGAAGSAATLMGDSGVVVSLGSTKAGEVLVALLLRGL